MFKKINSIYILLLIAKTPFVWSLPKINEPIFIYSSKSFVREWVFSWIVLNMDSLYVIFDENNKLHNYNEVNIFGRRGPYAIYHIILK